MPSKGSGNLLRAVGASSSTHTESLKKNTAYFVYVDQSTAGWEKTWEEFSRDLSELGKSLKHCVHVYAGVNGDSDLPTHGLTVSYLFKGPLGKEVVEDRLVQFSRFNRCLVSMHDLSLGHKRSTLVKDTVTKELYAKNYAHHENGYLASTLEIKRRDYACES